MKKLVYLTLALAFFFMLVIICTASFGYNGVELSDKVLKNKDYYGDTFALTISAIVILAAALLTAFVGIFVKQMRKAWRIIYIVLFAVAMLSYGLLFAALIESNIAKQSGGVGSFIGIFILYIIGLVPLFKVVFASFISKMKNKRTNKIKNEGKTEAINEMKSAEIEKENLLTVEK